MVPKPLREAIAVAKSFGAENLLKKIGLRQDDRYFVKQVGKALLFTYALLGAGWLYNERYPIDFYGWWMMPRPKEGKTRAHVEEKVSTHVYEPRVFPYPGEEEAVEVFVLNGGMSGIMTEAKGFENSDKDSVNYLELQDKKFEEEALKIWLRLRGEAVCEIQEKGGDVA